MKILVTGGAGFIGSHLTEALIREGHEVRVFDNLSSGSLKNLAHVSVEFIEGDIADWDAVNTAVSGCNIVFHQAALVSVPQSIKNPQLNHASNVTGAFHLFEAARQAGVQRVVYASSSAVYGNLPDMPHKETGALKPETPYAMAKRTNELMASAFASTYGTEFVGLRYMNVFGPRQDPSSPYSGVLSIFCQNVLAGKPLIIHGDGQQTRDFIYVSDVVKANLLAAKTTSFSPGSSVIFNVGRGQQTSLNQIVEHLAQITGQKIERYYEKSRAGDIKHSVADIELATQQLGFVPGTDVRNGLIATLDWFRKRNMSIDSRPQN
jgi:UDP-glucose 4-epimerase